MQMIKPLFPLANAYYPSLQMNSVHVPDLSWVLILNYSSYQCIYFICKSHHSNNKIVLIIIQCLRYSRLHSECYLYSLIYSS